MLRDQGGRYRPHIFGTIGSSTGTYEVCRFEKLVLWGCCHIRKNVVSFDVAPFGPSSWPRAGP